MIWVKRVVAIVALAVVVYLFWPLLGQIRAAADLFTTAHWFWLPVIIFMQLISYGFLTWLNLLSLRPFPGRINFFKMTTVLTSMAFIEVAIPSAGASGLALRARLLAKFGYSVEAATFSLVLETIYLAIALASLALLGIVYLVRLGDLTTSGLVSMVVAVVFLVAISWWVWRVLNNYILSHRLLVKTVSLWNRVFRRFHILDIDTLNERLITFQVDLLKIKDIPRWQFFLSAYTRIFIDVLSLGMCFYLFGYPIPLGTLFTGYGIMILLSGLAALPGGLGLADASIPVLFARLGTPGSYALVAGLGYRLLAFWFLRFIGFISWQYLEADHVDRADSPTL
jgi:uncharacterized protein (TIRG00374 family)